MTTIRSRWLRPQKRMARPSGAVEERATRDQWRRTRTKPIDDFAATAAIAIKSAPRLGSRAPSPEITHGATTTDTTPLKCSLTLQTSAARVPGVRPMEW